MFLRLKHPTGMTKLFKNRDIEVNPVVLVRTDNPVKNEFSFAKKKLVGVFFRVVPQEAREIFFVQSLPKNTMVFTPENGCARSRLSTGASLIRSPCQHSTALRKEKFLQLRSTSG